MTSFRRTQINFPENLIKNIRKILKGMKSANDFVPNGFFLIQAALVRLYSLNTLQLLYLFFVNVMVLKLNLTKS